MKKLVSVLLALALFLALCCAFAEDAALPAYTYAGDDPVLAAVIGCMLDMDSGITPAEGGVLIPTPIILKTDMNAEETEATVYGNFWLFTYVQNGKMLERTACGEFPGVMKLEKKDGAWTVVSLELADEGEAYWESIQKLTNGDEELAEQYRLTTGATEDSFLPQFQRAAVVNYVQENSLDIEAYQEPGEEPVSVTD